MRRLGDARIEAMALAVVDAIDRSAKLKLLDRGRAVHAVADGLKAAFQLDEGLDKAVRAKIASLSRSVPEGSREWDVLYRQYADELSHRRS